MGIHEFKCNRLSIHDFTNRNIEQYDDIKLLTKTCMWCGETQQELLSTP